MHADDFEIPQTTVELYDPGLYRWHCTACKMEDNKFFDKDKPENEDGNYRQRVLITWLFVGGKYDGTTYYDRCSPVFSEGSKLGQRAKGANGWAVIPKEADGKLLTFKPSMILGKDVDAGLIVEPKKMGANKGEPGNQVTFMRPAEGAAPAPIVPAVVGGVFAGDDIPFDY